MDFNIFDKPPGDVKRLCIAILYIDAEENIFYYDWKTGL